jgi:hypothetical protein
MDVIEIVSPEGEAVAILTPEAVTHPETVTAAASAGNARKASKPRQRKTTKKG